MSNQPQNNTDTHLFSEVDYAPSCHMTKERSLGINVGGNVYVMPLQDWHKLKSDNLELQKAIEGIKQKLISIRSL